MRYGLRGHEGERNNSIENIVGQKSIETKHFSLVKARLLFCCQNITNIAGGLTSSLQVAQPLRTQH